MIPRTAGFLALAALIALSPMAVAQQVPQVEPAYGAGTDLNRTLRDLEKAKLERDLQTEMKTSKPQTFETPTVPEAQTASEATVALREIEFSPSSLLTQDDLKSLSSEYLNRSLGIGALNELIGKINGWYRSRGYITALAVLPPQQIKDGKLRILLIEGKVGRVVIQGNETTRYEYITSRVKIPTGTVLSIKPLEKDLFWFNGTNDVKLRIKLQAGVDKGTTDYYLTVVEPPETQWSIFSDTAGSTDTGRTRAGISFSNNSVSGNRDSLNVTALVSKTSNSEFLSYTRPVNKNGTKLSVYRSINDLSVSRNDLNAFHITGKAGTTGLTMTHPLVIRAGYKEELVLDVHRQKSTNKILGMTFTDDDESRYSIGKTFLDITAEKAFYCKPVITVGSYQGIGESKYIRKFVFDGLWQKVGLSGQVITARLGCQKTNDDYLPSSDQYYLGGLTSVRGYNESVIGGDSGMNVKLDYQFLVHGAKKTHLFTFYDWGRIYGKSLLSTRMIHASGVGCKHTFTNDSQIVLTLGFPFVKKIGDETISSRKWDISLNFVF